MDLIKDIGKSLKFKERYDDLERTGMEEYDKEECKELRELSESGAPLSESQKETLHYCDTIKGERTRAAMNLGTSALKIGVGAATGNAQLAMQGVGDAGGYIMSEAQEVDGPNDGVGQKIGKEDYMKLGTDIVSGVGAYAAGKQSGGAGGGDGTGTDTGTGTGTGGAGGAGNTFNMMQTLMQNPQFMQMLQQMQGQQGGVNQNAIGSKLKRSTRNHDYIKGNTRGYK